MGKRRKKLKTDPRLARGGDGRLRVRRRRRRRPAPAADPPPILALRATQNLPKCEVCAKEFTSQAQLEEHNRGKAHLKATRAGGAKLVGGRGSAPRGAGCRPGARRRRRTRGSAATRAWPAAAPRVQHCALCRKPSRRMRNSPNTIEASGTSCASAGNSPRAENRTAPSDRCAVRERWGRCARATKHLYEIPYQRRRATTKRAIVSRPVKPSSRSGEGIRARLRVMDGAADPGWRTLDRTSASAHPRFRATPPRTPLRSRRRRRRRRNPRPNRTDPARAGADDRTTLPTSSSAATTVESPPAEKESPWFPDARAFAFGDVAVGFGVGAGAARAGEGLRARERGASSRASSAASARGGSPRARAVVQRR